MNARDIWESASIQYKSIVILITTSTSSLIRHDPVERSEDNCVDLERRF